MDPKQLLDRFRVLQAAHSKGSISREGVYRGCRELVQQDAQGVWWGVDPSSGSLLRYDQAKKIWVSPSMGGEPPSRAPNPAARAGAVPVSASPQSPPPRQGTASSRFLRAFLTLMLGIVGGLAVFIAGALISSSGWYVLGFLPQLTSNMIPRRTCAGLAPGSSAMFFCAAGMAVQALMGTFLTVMVMFLLRRKYESLRHKKHNS